MITSISLLLWFLQVVPLSETNNLSESNRSNSTSSVTIQLGEFSPKSEFIAALLAIKEGLYDTIATKQGNGAVTFQNIPHGQYLIGIEYVDKNDLYYWVPTYYGSVYEWIKADTLHFDSDTTIQVDLVEIPAIYDGPGFIDIKLNEQFGEIARPGTDRNCFLKRRRAGGRINQDADAFELMAYGKTNNAGEFTFAFLPEGVYRFFVEYPGIPIDEASFVQFEFGEAGVSDAEFKLEVLVTLEGFEISIEPILGISTSALKLYPNPTNDELFIQFYAELSKDHVFHIYNSAGKLVWKEQVMDRNDFSIDVSKYKPGIYWINAVDNEGNTSIKKFLKR